MRRPRTARPGPRHLVLVVGAPAFRQYPYEAGAYVEDGVRIIEVSQDPAEVHRSSADFAVLTDPQVSCAALAARVRVARRAHRPRYRRRGGDAVDPPCAGGDGPGREPLGFLSAAMRGLGFGLPTAIGVRMARPVIAVLANGGRAIMDELAERTGRKAPWPSFPEVRLSALATALGCPARRIRTYGELLEVLDDVLPRLRDMDAPLLLDVDVTPEPEFNPLPEGPGSSAGEHIEVQGGRRPRTRGRRRRSRPAGPGGAVDDDSGDPVRDGPAPQPRGRISPIGPQPLTSGAST